MTSSTFVANKCYIDYQIDLNIFLFNKLSLHCFLSVFTVEYGSWFDHVLGYYQLRHQDNFLALSYEDMKKVKILNILFCNQNFHTFSIYFNFESLSLGGVTSEGGALFDVKKE